MSYGDGTGWDVSLPTDSKLISGLPTSIREVNLAHQIRIEKEHVAYAASSVGGEHKVGSAKAYYQSSYPTKRPDGSTNLNSADNGRLLVISTDGHLEYWTGTGWVKVVATAASQFADGVLTVAKVANHFSTHLIGYAKLIDSEVNGTDGGTATSGSWFKRVLNTTVNDSEAFTTLSSSVVTLDAGTYRYKASCPGHKVNRHQCRLRDTTNSSTVNFGTSEYAPSADNTQTRCEVSGEFTVVADDTTFELQHRVESTRATDGLGVGVSFDGAETFAVLEIWKMT